MKKTITQFGFTLFLLFCIANNAISQNYTFEQLMDTVQEIESQKEYLLALELIQKHINNYPDHWYEISKEMIYLNDKLELYSDNLEIFKKGHKNGYFYLIHPQIRKYADYKNLSEFDEISKRDLELRREAIEKAHLEYEVKLPKNYNPKKKYSLIIILHGGGSTLERVLKHWNSPLLEKDFIRVYVQSFMYYDSNTFGWRVGHERTHSEMNECIRKIKKDYRIKTKKIIIGGISAGASFAIDFAFMNKEPLAGFLAICPGIPAILKEQKLNDYSKFKFKGYIIGGETDYYLARQKQMTEIFDDNKFNYKHLIIEGMGHEYPENENELIDKGIEFLLK